MKRLAIAIALVACAACGSATDSGQAADPFVGLGAGQGVTRDLPSGAALAAGRPGPGGGTILRAASAPIASGMPYRFSLGHCGLISPVDLDGSFWEATDGLTADGAPLDLVANPEMINATTGVIVVVGDEARLRTESGSVIRFERDGAEKEFPGCD